MLAKLINYPVLIKSVQLWLLYVIANHPLSKSGNHGISITPIQQVRTRQKITVESLKELGERLYAKITEVVIPEWESAFRELTEQDCIDYIYNLTINRTYDGYLREKSVINDGLAKIFSDITFEESDPELDHAGDIDYIAKVGDKAIGIQIKPITASANFGSYSLTERMKASFESFKEQYGGNVFIVFSLDGEIANKEVIEQIKLEINRLS